MFQSGCLYAADQHTPHAKLANDLKENMKLDGNVRSNRKVPHKAEIF
jgi:hypothetical protein